VESGPREELLGGRLAPSDQFRKDLDKDYAAVKSVMVELGLAKAQ
jgi:hypothetical protein